LGEFYAAGLCELPDATPIVRYARAYRRWFENCRIDEYKGSRLYPCGRRDPEGQAVLAPDYSFTMSWQRENFDKKLVHATPKQERTLHQLRARYELEERKVNRMTGPHTIGGNGYTHAIVNYGRVLDEGLDSYVERISAGQRNVSDQIRSDFYRAMADLIEGIQVWHGRLIETLRQGDRQCENNHKLLKALEQVPFRPARNFYEAIVAYNVVFYIDGCDNPGRMDQVLWPHYDSDLSVNHESALSLMREFFDNVCANGGWSMAIGGSHADGAPAYQELAEICLEASHHKYRPSIELRVRDDMPDRIWDCAMEALCTGYGQPAFYNEYGYLNALRSANLGISDKDIVKWNGGGCTETMLHGCSNVGSLDAGFNLPLILERTLERVLTGSNVEFNEILKAFEEDVRSMITEVVSQLNSYFAARAEYRPQPVRTLLMDDCIDRGKDFNAGGARYNWSVVNVAGLANVADSLEAIREIVFERKQIAPSRLLCILRENFAGNEPLRQMLLRCAKFGNDIDSVDSLAMQIGEFVYREIMSHQCRRGGRFLPSHIMFETFGYAGQQVGASPDGRRAGEPLSDSTGPVQGRDRKGPTAMLNSVARLPLHLAAGTPVLNIRFSKGSLTKPEGRHRVRVLIETYFRMGGLQIQISVIDRDELMDALEHPDKHENLVVRIGGYSTYFNWLSDEMKQEVIKRTEYLV
jgi:formate C-acetyltransferase